MLINILTVYSPNKITLCSYPAADHGTVGQEKQAYHSHCRGLIYNLCIHRKRDLKRHHATFHHELCLKKDFSERGEIGNTDGEVMN